MTKIRSGKEWCSTFIEVFDTQGLGWAIELEEGYDWWPKDRRSSISFQNHTDSEGKDFITLRFMTDVVRNIDLDKTTLEAINRISNNSSLSGLVYFEESKKLRLVSPVTFEAEDPPLGVFGRLQTAAVFQYREAETVAKRLSELAGATDDISENPTNGSRDVASSLVDLFDETIVAPRPSTSEDEEDSSAFFTDINECLEDFGWSLLTNFGATGLTTEFPWGKRGSSLTTFSIETHPILGHGIQIRQQFPAILGDKGTASALKLNFQELMNHNNFGLVLGGYSLNSILDTLQWSSFLPIFSIQSGVDLEVRKILTFLLVKGLVNRAAIISDICTEEPWNKESVDFKQSSGGRTIELFKAAEGKDPDQKELTDFVVDMLIKDRPQYEEKKKGVYGFDKDEMASTQGSSSSNDSTDKRDVEKVGDTMKNDIGMEFSWIPSGSFMMGSPLSEAERKNNEGPQRLVTIAQDFWMGRHPVTQGQYEAVMGVEMNFSQFKSKDYPVGTVSWDDAKAFISKLNAMNDGFVYSLPTEAEWEYAARAGTTTAFAFGDSLSSTEANFEGNYPYGNAPKGPFLGRTSKVGSYPPNAWGLYDMHGNIWEWVEDIFNKDGYAGLPTDGSANTTRGDSSLRVLRGGSWLDRGEHARSAYRNWYTPLVRFAFYGGGHGIRVVARPKR
jgi:formylglycine-generating enzyme required for sulfatase activity